MFRRLMLFALTLLPAVVGCAKRDIANAPPSEAETPLVSGIEGDNNPAFHDKLLAVARVYHVYRRVDDPPVIIICAQDYCPPTPPPVAHYSRSTDASTHGKHMYSAFARFRQEYLCGTDVAGQVVVKETWVPEEFKGELPKSSEERTGVAHLESPITVREDLAPNHSEQGLVLPVPTAPDGRFYQSDSGFYPYAKHGDKTYKASRRGDLFIMYHLDPATPGTDHGWVYGTVTPDGKTVTSAGRVASCMRCHQSLSSRLFGHRY